MTRKYELSRRKVLAGLGTIGVGAAGAGLGTTAFFSDQETFANNQLTAGSLDMKVAWSEHYSDWMGDETSFARMPADGESPSFRLPAPADRPGGRDIELIFEDPPGDDDGTDSRPNQEDGGRQFFRNTQVESANGGLGFGGPADLCTTDADAPDRPLIDLDDVKPGDFGFALFRFQLCDNPGFVWLTGGLESASENDLTEPEAGDPDEDGDADSTDPADVELLDAIQVAYGVGTTRNLAAAPGENLFPEPDPNSAVPQPAEQLSLREFLTLLESGEGVPLEGDVPAEEGGGIGRNCFAGGTAGEGHYVSVVWWLPVDHANEVQTDAATFDLGFYTEQCRHNESITRIDLPVEDVYVGYEDRQGGDFDYNDFGMDANITEAYSGDPPLLEEVRMDFESRFHRAGDDHDIHIERSLPGDVSYEYTVSRSSAAAGNETPAGTYTGSGTLDLVLFDTAHFTQGETVSVEVTVTGGSETPPTSSPRSDMAADNPLFEVYDPYMDDRTIGAERHIEDFQPDDGEFDRSGFDVPYVIAVPVTNFSPPSEGTTIDDEFPDFDDYYATGDAQYADWYNP